MQLTQKNTTFPLLLLFLITGNVVAEGNITTSSGSLILNPANKFVLPATNTVSLGADGSSTTVWSGVYSNWLFLRDFGDGAGFRLRNSTGSNVFHWLYYQPTRTMYMAETGVAEIMMYTQGSDTFYFGKSLSPFYDNTASLGSNNNAWTQANIYSLRLKPTPSLGTCSATNDGELRYYNSQLRFCISNVWKTVALT